MYGGLSGRIKIYSEIKDFWQKDTEKKEDNDRMERINIEHIIDEVVKCVEKHELFTGGYSRYGEDTINEYGCADAANILYTINRFPKEPAVRAEWVKTLQSMQDSETGLYSEPTHFPMHTTAHCVAALELFDALPVHPIYAYEKYTKVENLYSLLEEEVDWKVNPWRYSHMGAGIYVCLVLTDMVDAQWRDGYFEWMWEHSHEEMGFFVHGDPTAELYMYMAGGFHYMFNHEYDHRAYRYPEKIIDSCLELIENCKHLFVSCGFIDVDVVYALNRAMRQTPYRFYEAKAALEKYAIKYIAMLDALDFETDKYFNDLHMLFGTVCCLAELQIALPGKIMTEKPLRLVLDRRPFI